MMLKNKAPTWAWVLGFWLLFSTAANTAEKTETAPPEESRTQEIEDLRTELQQLKDDQQELRAERERTDSEIRNAPELSQQIRKQIQVLEASPDETSVPKSLEKLESAIRLLESQAKAMQQSLSDVMKKIAEQQALPAVAQKEVTSAQKKIRSLQEKIEELRQATTGSPVAGLRLEVKNQLLENTVKAKELAQFRLEGYQSLLDLYSVSRDFLILRMDIITSALEALREKRDQLRLAQAGVSAEKTKAKQAPQEQEPKWMAEQRKLNGEYTKQLVALTQKLNRSNDGLVAEQQALQDIQYQFDLAKQQLQLTQYYQNVDDLLFRQRQALQVQIRELESQDGLESEIAAARLQQFLLDERMQAVRTEAARNRTIASLLKKNPVQSSEQSDIKQSLAALLMERRDILNRLINVQAEHVISLTNQQLSIQEGLQVRKEFYELLNEKLFWRRSAAPLGLTWITHFPSSVTWLIGEHDWTQIPKIWFDYLVRPVYPVLGLMLFAVAFLWAKKGLLKRLQRVGEKVGNVNNDKFRYTLEAALISVILSSPWPLLMLFLTTPLMAVESASIFVAGVGKALWSLTRWLFLFELVRQVCRPAGLARQHLNWPVHILNSLKRWLPILYLQLPVVFVYLVVWQEGDDYHSGLVGRGAFLLAAGLFLYSCYSLFRPNTGITKPVDGSSRWYRRWNVPIFYGALSVPVSLIVLSLRGYSFSAMEIMVLIYNTVAVGFMVFLVGQIAGRWFAVAERKLAWRRAVEKRDAMKKAKQQSDAVKNSGEGVPELELPVLDVDAISEQNRALLGVLSFTLFAVLVSQIWQDFFQAVQAFQDVVLWTYATESDVGVVNNEVTLATLLYLLIALLVIYVGVKNLPGLIEVSILERFSVDSGIRFAITTIARYLVVVVGIMVVSPMIGLEWSKLGWLVAALGVGLGFGLQEIFANFISGLIILFERPIRIGDTVTINELSGTVSQIRMRATTITDWDKKEIIIPNKTFVTSQFINWTLSDNTTRIVVKVGVAYGSDTDMVTKTLLEIADNNELILKEPVATAFFLGFGASSLDFELRVFVNNFANRLPVIHELHMEIDEQFSKQGISIAFPQLDLHVKEIPSSQ